MSKAHLKLNSFFPYQLAQLQAQVSQYIAQSYTGEFSLSKAEWRILAVINNQSPLTAKEIGQLTSLEKMPASRAIKRLLEKELVTKQECDQDKRASLLSPTDEGKATFQALAPKALELEQQLLSELSMQEQQQLASTLAKLQQRISELSREAP